MFSIPATSLRVIGALALFGVSADHAYEYYVDHYSAIPTIGTLFLLNAISAAILGLALLAPVKAVLGQEVARWVVGLASLSGIVLAASSLAGLFVSESEPLFGFMEVGYRPVIWAAIATEALAVAALIPLAALAFRSARSEQRPQPSRRKTVA